VRVVALIENSKLEGREDLVAEHGLSLYIESEDKRILFDVGATEAYDHNAAKLGIDLQEVDLVVVSHRHYDHGGGLAHFLQANHKAKVYLRKSAQEEYYARRLGGLRSRYIGLDQELLRKQADRFEYVEGLTEVLPQAYILTEIAQPYALPRGNRRLFVKQGRTYRRDPFEHELVMVVREREELVVFTGCAHTGILNIVAAVTRQFPELPIVALFGGLHLVAESARQVRSIGEALRQHPIGRVFTGHCIGTKSYQVLKAVMEERSALFPTGSEVVL
jgi:7,8-dihydropterin-6-yl-methyl-4-(beta-D-ribofuranosyl)aminobenzene 5'-phosphate synthase